MKKFIYMVFCFVLIILFSVSTCNAAITKLTTGKDISNVLWMNSKWRLHPTSFLNKVDSYIVLSKNITNPKTEKEDVFYWIKFNDLQDKYCFFSIIGNHMIKIDDEVYDIPISISKVKRICENQYDLYTSAYLNSKVISKLQKANKVTIYFIYADISRSPIDCFEYETVNAPKLQNVTSCSLTEDYESITIPKDVLMEWKRLIDMTEV